MIAPPRRTHVTWKRFIEKEEDDDGDDDDDDEKKK